MIDFKNTFAKIEPINKGWSSDKKYYVETAADEKLLLRIANIAEYDKKKTEFEMMQRLVQQSDLAMSQPVDFGMCDNGKSVYSLFTWCDGEDAEMVLPKLPETIQYELGLKSGKMLREIHNIPAPVDQEPWDERFNQKADNKIKNYLDCGITIEDEHTIIAYIEANRHLLKDRPQCFQHGDYHVGNMIVSADEQLSIIDFNRYDYGDPWEEIKSISWSAMISPHFATGQLNGYFNGRPPKQFFKLLAFYMSVDTLSSIPWSMPFGEHEVTVAINKAKDVLTWFDGMNQPIPTWYLADFYVQYIDRVPYKLKSPFDFSFIENYGEVFKVYDDQDSGNICFGVKNDDQKLFIKFAGAPTEQYDGQPEDAIARLKSTVPTYQDLAHDHLIKLIKAEEVGGGFATIFEWFDGECMGRMYPLSREKFLQMPDSARIDVFNDILAFHIYVAKQGYVAIDFYDGSIMYDFDLKKTMICDIDFYSKLPYVNSMGRMWGSARFMSPEEHTLGATIDEISNVYLMGATAFALFGGDADRSVEKWRLSDELYDVALKAINDNRDDRHQSLAEFESEWKRASIIY